ncbi:MAG: DM13 domain-containing protein [Planctomycetes bacterium]|nr:DM13 domain-containing protein [Planctomycetota bacterium]
MRTSIGTKVTQLKLVFGSNFLTDSGPDLKVVLSPLAADQVASKTALRHSFIVGALASNKGASSYDLPLDIDLKLYKSVLIHCEKYTKLWASAPLSNGEVIASGKRWEEKAKSVRGGWEIAQVGKTMVLRLGEDFKTKSAADLKLVLSPNSVANSNNDNALENAVIIGGLQKVKGAQQYLLPDDLDLKKYSSLLIHCKEYSKLWGGTSITD